MAKYFNQLSNSEQFHLISEILTTYNNLNKSAIVSLIEKTDEIKGVAFVNIKGYCSDKSNNTEIADQRVNIGASYSNMQTKDFDKYNHVNYSDFCELADNFNLKYINTCNIPELDFRQAIKDSYLLALAELQASKSLGGERVDNFIYFNRVLAYNTNTKNLSILGSQVSKLIKQSGEIKLIKSSPKTIAKQLINKCVESRTATLRRFNIGNITSHISLMGDEIELG
jgi:hypothetical protein